MGKQFDIRLEGDDDQLRKAFRTRVPGLDADIDEVGGIYPVKDLSAGGFAVLDSVKRFKVGDRYSMNLLLNQKLFLGKVNIVVMRIMDNGIVGFSFADLDRRKSIKLDKLVLEVQKRLIKLRKAKQNE